MAPRRPEQGPSRFCINASSLTRRIERLDRAEAAAGLRVLAPPPARAASVAETANRYAEGMAKSKRRPVEDPEETALKEAAIRKGMASI